MSKILTSVLQGRDFIKSKTGSFLALVALSVLISLSGPICIKLPFTPVPISLQSHVCLLIALTLGAKRASWVVLGYLFQGLIGLPVFSHGGSGFAHFMGPTGGYLIGYVAGTFITGWIAEKLANTYLNRVVALACGSAVILLCGALWLGNFVGFSQALALGVLPFITGDLLKTLVFAQLGKK